MELARPPDKAPPRPPEKALPAPPPTEDIPISEPLQTNEVAGQPSEVQSIPQLSSAEEPTLNLADFCQKLSEGSLLVADLLQQVPPSALIPIIASAEPAQLTLALSMFSFYATDRVGHRLVLFALSDLSQRAASLADGPFAFLATLLALENATEELAAAVASVLNCIVGGPDDLLVRVQLREEAEAAGLVARLLALDGQSASLDQQLDLLQDVAEEDAEELLSM